MGRVWIHGTANSADGNWRARHRPVIPGPTITGGPSRVDRRLPPVDYDADHWRASLERLVTASTREFGAAVDAAANRAELSVRTARSWRLPCPERGRVRGRRQTSYKHEILTTVGVLRPAVPRPLYDGYDALPKTARDGFRSSQYAVTAIPRRTLRHRACRKQIVRRTRRDRQRADRGAHRRVRLH